MANDFKRSGVYEIIRDLFKIDARSLATFRALIAAVVFVQAISSLGIADSETGAATRLSQELSKPGGGTLWSLCWISDSPNWIWVCAMVNVLGSICLFLGFRTFLATVVCLVLTWSHEVSNPAAVSAGQSLLRLSLFWGLFLPWGSCWSIDSRKYADPRPAKWSVASFGTAGIMLQLGYFYFFSGLAYKLGSSEGSGLGQNANLNNYIKSLGSWTESLSSALVLVLIVGSVLLFVPRLEQFCRGMAVALMLLTHAWIGWTMSLVIFPIVAIAMWFVFVPSTVWNGILGRPNKFEQDQFEEYAYVRRCWQGVCLVFILFVLALNIFNVTRTSTTDVSGKGDDSSGVWSPMDSVANITMTRQKFELFADPPSVDR